LEEIKKIKKACDDHGLALHLDGARLFNALVVTGEDPAQYGGLFDTISVCFSKGLGAPVGSVLLGSKEQMQHARRVRKAMGGAMRQAGYLAAACLFALDHQVERLREDHRRAKEVGKLLASLACVKDVMPVQTNIVIATLDGILVKDFLERLTSQDIYAVPFGEGKIRMVTHLDFHDDHLEALSTRIRKIF
jgi:threonine aldolase